jgi:hypothetical protein
VKASTVHAVLFLGLIACGLRSSRISAADVETKHIRVEPRATDGLFSNPDMGWQTFHRFADEAQSAN